MKDSISSEEVVLLLKSGKRFVFNNYVFVYKLTNKEVNRFAVVISKKSIKRANKRNYVKRVVRCLLKEVEFGLDKNKLDLIILYRNKELEKNKLKESLREAIKNFSKKITEV